MMSGVLTRGLRGAAADGAATGRGGDLMVVSNLKFLNGGML